MAFAWPRPPHVLTGAAVEGGVRGEHSLGGEVHGVAGEADVAADGGLRVQLDDGVRLGRGAGTWGRWGGWILVVS